MPEEAITNKEIESFFDLMGELHTHLEKSDFLMPAITLVSNLMNFKIRPQTEWAGRADAYLLLRR